MADIDTNADGLGATQEEAISIGDARDSSSDVDMIVASAVTQLNNDLQNSAEFVEDDASVVRTSSNARAASNDSDSAEEVYEALYEDTVNRDGIAVVVPAVQNPWEYRKYEEPVTAVAILEEYDDGGLLEYLVQFSDETEEVVSLLRVILLLHTSSISFLKNRHF